MTTNQPSCLHCYAIHVNSMGGVVCSCPCHHKSAVKRCNVGHNDVCCENNPRCGFYVRPTDTAEKEESDCWKFGCRRGQHSPYCKGIGPANREQYEDKQPEPVEWEERLEDMFDWGGMFRNPSKSLNVLKSFIRSLLEEKGKERFERFAHAAATAGHNAYELGQRAERELIIALAEGMKKNYKGVFTLTSKQVIYSYDDALADLITKLKEQS